MAEDGLKKQILKELNLSPANSPEQKVWRQHLEDQGYYALKDKEKKIDEGPGGAGNIALYVCLIGGIFGFWYFAAKVFDVKPGIITGFIGMILGFVVWILLSIFTIDIKNRDNKSGSEYYLKKTLENPNIIGGTNQDRFFVECVLNDYTDFSKQINVKHAETIAKTYNLDYKNDVKALYDKAKYEHDKLSASINYQENEKKYAEKRLEERKQYDELIKYAELIGKNKRIKMLSDKTHMAERKVRRSGVKSPLKRDKESIGSE